MLSKRMTAKSRAQKPANQDSDNTVNLSSDCRPNNCSDCDLLASFDREDDLPVVIAIAYTTDIHITPTRLGSTRVTGLPLTDRPNSASHWRWQSTNDDNHHYHHYHHTPHITHHRPCSHQPHQPGQRSHLVTTNSARELTTPASLKSSLE